MFHDTNNKLEHGREKKLLRKKIKKPSILSESSTDRLNILAIIYRPGIGAINMNRSCMSDIIPSSFLHKILIAAA